MTRLYTTDAPEQDFTIIDTAEEHLENMRNRNIAKYRVKSTWSGNMLEVEGYPLWNISQRKNKRNVKENTSSLAQKRINDKNRARRLTRIVQANFVEGEDLYTTFSYDDVHLPKSEEAAHRIMMNFIRRQKYWLSKQEKYKNFKLKYVFVTEYKDSEGKKLRVHHHMITNFPDRDILEDLWRHGGRNQTRRLKADKNGLAGVVNYILKQPADKNTKKYSISRNMKEPKVSVADSKMTRKRAERIACGEVDTQALFEKMYPGYEFIEVETKFSDFVSGAYIYVKMKRIEPINQRRKRE